MELENKWYVCTMASLWSTIVCVWVVGKPLTSAAGHADSARLAAGPPGPSSSSSCDPWSSDSGCRQTSSRPCLWLWRRPAWSPSGGCACSLDERETNRRHFREVIKWFKKKRKCVAARQLTRQRQSCPTLSRLHEDVVWSSSLHMSK